MLTTMILIDGDQFIFAVEFESDSSSYFAKISSKETDWMDRKIKRESFGNGVLAENRVLEFMENPNKALEGICSRNESIALGFIKIIS